MALSSEFSAEGGGREEPQCSLTRMSLPLKVRNQDVIFGLNVRINGVKQPGAGSRFVKVYTAKKKISKDKGVEPTEFEESVAQALFDLENTNTEFKSDLKDLYINAAV